MMMEGGHVDEGGDWLKSCPCGRVCGHGWLGIGINFHHQAFVSSDAMFAFVDAELMEVHPQPIAQSLSAAVSASVLATVSIVVATDIFVVEMRLSEHRKSIQCC